LVRDRGQVYSRVLQKSFSAFYVEISLGKSGERADLFVDFAGEEEGSSCYP
jgi:hypothetical protein